MAYHQPGDPYSLEIETYHPVTGVRTSADSLPTILATRNGVDDLAFALTPLLLGTGRYLVTGTIPSNYRTGDQVSIGIYLTVATIHGKDEIDSFGIIAGA